MSKKRIQIELREPDFRLFEYLHAVKIATYKQIHRDVFESYSYKSSCNRLRRLEDCRLLSIASSRYLSKGEQVVSLSKHAFSKYVAREGNQRVELKSDAIRHDLSLVDIRSRFLGQRSVAKYLTENEIQTWHPELLKLNSDAIVTVEIGSRKIEVPLEFESSRKKRSRYDQLLQQYYREHRFPLVFYVAEDQGILDCVSDVERTLFQTEEPKFFYLLKSDMQSFGPIKLVNYNSDELILK